MCKNVKVAFLPPNTTLILQPMDQGVIATFKVYYLRKTLSQASNKTKDNDSIPLKIFWKNYNVKDAMEKIKEAWDLVTPIDMRAVWQNIIPHCANDFVGFETIIKSTISEINLLGTNLGFTELDSSSIEEVFLCQDKEFEDDDLINVEQERAGNNEESDDEEIETK